MSTTNEKENSSTIIIPAVLVECNGRSISFNFYGRKSCDGVIEDFFSSTDYEFAVTATEKRFTIVNN